MADTVLVVDGYNAIYALPETRKALDRGLRCARELILDICNEYARSSGYITRVRVVFDGDDNYRYLDRMAGKRAGQIFSSTGKGDDKIIDTVRKISRQAKVVLASNDNYVRNWSRGHGAFLIHVEDLMSRKKKVRISKNSVKKKISSSEERRITGEYGKELGL